MVRSALSKTWNEACDQIATRHDCCGLTRAIVVAISPSVTVSIGEDTIGVRMRMLRVMLVLRSTYGATPGACESWYLAAAAAEGITRPHARS